MNMTDEHGKTGACGTVITDRYYTGEKNERQMYDLAIPAGASGSTGLVFCIHGGAWVGGDKEIYQPLLKRAAEEFGLAAAAINYRYVGETVGFDDILDDITASLAAIKAEGARHGVSFDRALLTGVSAGGHLSLLYAYTLKDAAPVTPVCVVELCGPTDLENGFYYSEENDIAKAQGVECLYRLIGNGVKTAVSPERFDDARPALKKYSPVNFVDKNTVPTVFGHGERDTVVPYRNALDLEARLKACGAEHTFISFPDSGHGCEDKASMKKTMDLFFAYADKYLK